MEMRRHYGFRWILRLFTAHVQCHGRGAHGQALTDILQRKIYATCRTTPCRATGCSHMYMFCRATIVELKNGHAHLAIVSNHSRLVP